MSKKPTRDELIAENARLKEENEQYAAKDETVRESLSVALGAGTYKKNMYSDYEQVVYSWYAIFRELGKLLAKRDYVDFSDQLFEAKELSQTVAADFALYREQEQARRSQQRP